ncbi:MAG: ribonuclease HII, partial [Candidatus Binatia bacterium]
MIAGIDEAGCAPLAGPVVAAAVILPPMERRPKALRGLTDSKLLSRDDRERYFQVILRLARVGVGAASVGEIDRLNILRADMLAMRRALAALGTAVDVALVDGNRVPTLPCRVHT